MFIGAGQVHAVVQFPAGERRVADVESHRCAARSARPCERCAILGAFADEWRQFRKRLQEVC